MNCLEYILQDWSRNRKNTKGKIITILFRIAYLVGLKKYLKYPFFLYLGFYRFFVESVLGIELPWVTKVGRGLVIYHGQSLIVNKNTIIGENCTLRQSTTIGNSRLGGKSPVIGNNVDIGSNVCLLGDISIGDNVVIGAGSVVVKNIPSNSVVVGNPARIIKTIQLGA